MSDAKVRRPRRDRLRYQLGDEGPDEDWQPADWRTVDEIAQIVAEATGVDTETVVNALKDAHVAKYEQRKQADDERLRATAVEQARREANATELYARLANIGLDDLFKIRPSGDSWRGREGDGLSIDFVTPGTQVGDKSQATQIVSRLEQWRKEVIE